MDNEKLKKIAYAMLAFFGWHQIEKPLRDDIWSAVFGGISGALSGAGQGAIRSAAPVVSEYKILPNFGDKDISLAGWIFLIGLCLLFVYVVAPLNKGGGSSRPSGPMRSKSMDDDDDFPVRAPIRPSGPGPGPGAGRKGSSSSKNSLSAYLPVVVVVAGVVFLASTPQGKQILEQLPLEQVGNLRSLLPF